MTKRLNLAFRPRVHCHLPHLLPLALLHSRLAHFPRWLGLRLRAFLFFLLYFILLLFFLSRRGLIFFRLALVFRPTSFRACPSPRPSAGGRGLSYTSNAAPSIPLLSHAAHFWSTPSSSEGSSGHHSRLPSLWVLVSAHHLALSSGSVVLCVRGRLDGMAEVSR